jgi:hypothetical protein
LPKPLALLLVGAWLGVLLASWGVATLNFRMVDRVLGPEARAELQERLAPVRADERRVAFRHLASELNRFLFRTWGLVQLALGVAVAMLLWRDVRGGRLLSVTVLVIVLAQLALGASIASLGRAIDFVARPLPADVGRRFGILHAGFVGLDLLKAGLLGVLATLLIRK